MKTNRISLGVFLMVSAVGFGSGSARADEVSTPPVMCAPGMGCNAQMTAIANQFDGLTTAPDAKSFPAVFSGECYYMGFNTDPDVTQYGMNLFDIQNGEPVNSGLLSFFATPNPYKDLDVAQARALLATEGDGSQPMLFGDTVAEVQYLSSNGAVLYWFRQDPTTRDVIMLGLWDLSDAGVISKVFCRLAPNQ